MTFVVINFLSKGTNMRNMVPTVVQWVCQDCFILHCNGDISPDCPNPDDLMTKLDGYEPSAGMLREEHGCDEDDEECDCETISFSWSSCDGCGSNLGGERHAMTGWVPETQEN